MRAASTAYLTVVVEHDYRAAHDLLCDHNRQNQPVATWQPVQDGPAAPTGFRITGADANFEVWNSFEVAAEITRPGSPAGEVLLSLAKQDGTWRVCDPPRL